MDKQNVTNFIKGVRSSVSKHSPEILTSIGIAGMITTVVLAVKATPKALELIEEEKRQQNYELRKEAEQEGYDTYAPVSELKPLDTVKVAWKPYIPAAITGAVSIACLIGSNSVHARRNAAIATAYKLSETALAEYKEKVVETIGEKKEKVVREKIAQDKVDKHPVSKSEVIVAGPGGVLFLEPVSMRPFTSDIESVRKAINDINYRLTTGMEEYISLSDFYDEIGLSHTSNSDDLGWNLGRDGQIKVDFLATKTDDGRPCLMMDYQVSPRYDYHKLM